MFNILGIGELHYKVLNLALHTRAWLKGVVLFEVEPDHIGLVHGNLAVHNLNGVFVVTRLVGLVVLRLERREQVEDALLVWLLFFLLLLLVTLDICKARVCLVIPILGAYAGALSLSNEHLVLSADRFFGNIFSLESVSVNLTVAHLVNFKAPLFFVDVHQILNLEAHAGVNLLILALAEQFLQL